MSSKLQLDICYLSLHRRHLVNAYEVFAGKTLLCDPYLSAFSECEPTIKALYKYIYLYLFTFTYEYST